MSGFPFDRLSFYCVGFLTSVLVAILSLYYWIRSFSTLTIVVKEKTG